MFSGIPNSHLYAAYRIISEFVLRDGATKGKSGTAFFVRNSQNTLCLVSNRHIMDIGYGENGPEYVGAQLETLTVEGYVATAQGNNALPESRVSLRVQTNVTPPVFAVNYDEDVACVINPQVVSEGGAEPRIDFWIGSNELANDEWIRDCLSICDFVAFPGFPPWYDRLGNRPILRTGAIASDPRTGYSDEPRQKGRRVAFEAFSFGGSSGSPVFATQKGFRAGPGIQVSGFREGRLVGINAGHFNANLGAHSGVSYFVKSSAILDLIN